MDSPKLFERKARKAPVPRKRLEEDWKGLLGAAGYAPAREMEVSSEDIQEAAKLLAVPPDTHKELSCPGTEGGSDGEAAAREQSSDTDRKANAMGRDNPTALLAVPGTPNGDAHRELSCPATDGDSDAEGGREGEMREKTPIKTVHGRAMGIGSQERRGSEDRSIDGGERDEQSTFAADDVTARKLTIDLSAAVMATPTRSNTIVEEDWKDEGSSCSDDMHLVRTDMMRKLLRSEREYNEKLNLLVQVVMGRLLAHAEDKSSSISVEEVKYIFANIKVIRGYNMLLLSELEERLSHWHERQCVADIFVKMAVFFKTYTQFTDGLDKRREMLGIMRLERKALNTLCSQIESDPRLGHDSIYNLILEPRERIKEYAVVLQELRQCTAREHEDYSNICEARELFLNLFEYMNDSNARANVVDAIVAIQKRLDGKKKLALMVPGRELVKEDKMWKLKSGKMSERRIYLFSDLLLITKPGKKGKEHVTNVSDLAECSGVSPFRVDGEMRGVNICVQDETVCLYENTPGEGEVWFFMLVEALVAAAEEQHRLAVSPRVKSLPTTAMYSKGGSAPTSPRSAIRVQDTDGHKTESMSSISRSTSFGAIRRELAKGRSKTPRGTHSTEVSSPRVVPISARGPSRKREFNGTIYDEELPRQESFVFVPMANVKKKKK